MPEKDTPVRRSSAWLGFLDSPIDRLLLVGIAGLMPLLAIQAANLWNRPHFQFFPIAWFVFFAVVYHRGQLVDCDSTLRRQLGFGLLLLSLFSAIAAMTLQSPWFSQLGLILLLLGWMSLRLGDRPWYAIAGWTSLLIVTLPLPLNGDARLVQALQLQSTRAACTLLDITSTPNLGLGNVIQIPPGKLFVDQACSGIDSLYALTAVALAMAIWHERSLIVSILTLASVPLWAWIGNLTRLFVIATVFDRFDIDWTHGWQHTLLGLIIFACSFAGLMGTLTVLSTVLAPLPSSWTESKAGFRTVASWYNRMMTWPMSTRADQAVELPAEAALERTRVPGRVFAGLLTSAFAICGLASIPSVLGVGPWKPTAVVAQQISTASVRKIFTASNLPTDWSGMRQLAFEISHRETNSIFGEHSASWTYQKGDRQLILSLDFPFADFHLLEMCYESSGSQFLDGMQEEELGDVKSLQFVSSGGMRDQFGQESFLCYTEFTGDDRSRSRYPFAERGLFRSGSRNAVFQLQLLVPYAKELTERDKLAYSQILLAAKQRLLPFVQRLGESR